MNAKHHIGTLCLLAGGAWALPALAQDGAVVYGVVDTFLTRIDVEGKAPATRIDASGAAASRLGVRGTENLGNGIKANFTLEAGLNSNDGSGADTYRLFNRQAWVGLSTSWGEFRLGRQNTPQFYMNGKFDAFGGTTQASGWNNFAGAALRVDNAVGLFTDVAGVKLHLLWARGALAGAPLLPEVAGNRNWHLAAEYERGPWYLGINHEDVANTALPYRVRRTALGTSWRFGPAWKAFLAVNRERASDRSIDSALYSASVLYDCTASSSIAVGYAAFSDHQSGQGHGSAHQASIQYRYRFSKRTMAYAGYAQLDQQGSRNSFVLAGAAVVQPGARITAAPGGAITGWQLGLTHVF
jgi:predicted porin